MGIVTDQVLDSNKLMASDSPKTSQLLGEIGQPHGMMKDPVGAVVVGVGPPDGGDERQVVAVRASYRIHDAEPADGEHHHACAHTTQPCIAVGGLPCV